jgi:hypothetical protein
MTARIAVETEEALGEDAAAQERAKLLLDEVGRGLISAVGTREEALQLLANHLVKKRLLRLVALVVRHGRPRTGTGVRR